MIWTIFVFLGGICVAQEYPGLPVVKDSFNNIAKIFLRNQDQCQNQKTIIEKLLEIFKK
jgi:hypothetical protein